MLFDQFKVERSDSLNSDLRDVRKENLDSKASIERNTRKIKALEDRLSKCSVPPIVNSQTGMQSHNRTGTEAGWTDPNRPSADAPNLSDR